MKTRFRNEQGAVDLPSVLVGLTVAAILAAITAVSMLVVIPWFEEKSVDDNFTAIHHSEVAARSDMSRYIPLSANPTGSDLFADEYLDHSMFTRPVCVVVPADGQTYTAYSQSTSGDVFSYEPTKRVTTAHTGTVPCNFLLPG